LEFLSAAPIWRSALRPFAAVDPFELLRAECGVDPFVQFAGRIAQAPTAEFFARELTFGGAIDRFAVKLPAVA